MKQYIVKDLQETEKVAKNLASSLKGGELIALSGNLGAGKTAFVKALARALGIKEEINSPTFVLLKVYDIAYKKVNKFVHVDCYRLRGQEDLFDIGLGDYLNYDNIIVAIEWADKIVNLPKDAIKVHLEIVDNNQRKIIFS
ncbi:MAG: tRNA (adenosine(37)-N6)-threonylcarbamoyltransferase complex ATPase subunit type 1 TsaE [Patescibacteria group bacterium]|nr:tRNA (adenosine(37)-N6)-threonylcarbamoyltransferase complex ATPase subunit type 1 TsaE [Patescibacteria group bacterium]